MAISVWKLELTDTLGNTHKVCGTEQVLRGAIQEWIDATQAVDGLGQRVLEIHGFYDSADKADVMFTAAMDSIRQLYLVKLY